MQIVYPHKAFILFLFSFVCLALPLHAQQIISDESPIYKNLNLDKVEVSLQFKDAEINAQAVAANLQVYFADTAQRIDSLSQAQQSSTTLLLSIQNVYDLKIQANKYQDTTLRLDLKTFQGYQLSFDVGLKPDKIPYEITILDLNTDEVLPLGGVMHNRSRPEQILLNTPYGEAGHYRIRVREEDEYEMEVQDNEGYIFYSTDKIIPRRGEENHLKVQVVKSLKANTNIRLYNVNFAYNSAELNQEAKKELTKISPLIRQHPQVRLEIAAHTDSDGTKKGNLLLSEARAKRVKDFLLTQGISATQLITKGYGDTQPIASNATEKGKAQNRRFEVKVLEVP